MPQILDEIVNVVFLTSAPADRRAIVMSLFHRLWRSVSTAHRGTDCRSPRATGRERNCAGGSDHSPALLRAYVHRLSMCQCLRFGTNRQSGEVDECNSGPSSNRDVPCPQIMKTTVEVVEIVSQEWTSGRICGSALLNKSWLFLRLDSGTNCGSSSLLCRDESEDFCAATSLVVRVFRRVVVDCAGGSSALDERLPSHLHLLYPPTFFCAMIPPTSCSFRSLLHYFLVTLLFCCRSIFHPLASLAGTLSSSRIKIRFNIFPCSFVSIFSSLHRFMNFSPSLRRA